MEVNYMSLESIKHALNVADASGRNLSREELLAMFGDKFPAHLIDAAIAGFEAKGDKQHVTDAGGAKADAGVEQKENAEKKVEEEIFAMRGTGKETGANKGAADKGHGIG